MQDDSKEISRDEWIARYGNDDGFRDYDLNGDNHINRNEWIAGRTADAEFREADTDGNMQIDREEWVARCVGVAGTISHQLPVQLPCLRMFLHLQRSIWYPSAD